MTKFKQGERYPTRNGGEALVLGIKDDGLIVCSFYKRDGSWDHVIAVYANGRNFDVPNCEWDILPPPPETRDIFVNIGRDATGRLYIRGEHDTREEAEEHSGEPRVGCHRITLRAEFEPSEPTEAERKA